MKRTILPRLSAAFLLALATAGFTPAPAPKPRLIVVLTVDQMRGDYLGRFSRQWTGGFARIYGKGAVFTNALQDHALTQTAPGHSTILSGREPAHTNIVFNDVGVPDTTVSLIGSSGTGASPHRFKGTALLDWMRDADSAVRVLSVSRKDRGAILPIGRSKSPVFWYSQGRFTTSTWYADTLPAWVTGWNARGGVARLNGMVWNLLLPDSSYPERDDQAFENGGKSYSFPHPVPSADSAALADGITEFPWMDSLTLDIALEGVKQIGLGQRSGTDLLTISLSSTDAIGHDFGPDSRELHDQLLRLDRFLGWFLDSLAVTVPAERTLIVLTADHGVTPYPQIAQANGKPAGFIALNALVKEANTKIGANIVKTTSGLIYADTAALRALKVNPESLATALTARVQKVAHVVDAWSPATLGAPRNNVGAVRWWRSLPRDFPFLVCAVAEPGYVWSSVSQAEHGTSNQSDVNVTLAFLGSGISAGIFPDTVRTVDIAPTLAKLLDIKAPKKLDGRPIKRITK